MTVATNLIMLVQCVVALAFMAAARLWLGWVGIVAGAVLLALTVAFLLRRWLVVGLVTNAVMAAGEVWLIWWAFAHRGDEDALPVLAIFCVGPLLLVSLAVLALLLRQRQLAGAHQGRQHGMGL